MVQLIYLCVEPTNQYLHPREHNCSLKLMASAEFHEGRMRGQAFLTFPSIELAHHALVRIS